MTRKTRKTRTPEQLDGLLQAMNLRQTCAIEHQNELFARVEKLEVMPRRIDSSMKMALSAHDRIDELKKTAKQSPSDRYLFARVRELEAKLNAFDFIDRRPAPDLRGFCAPVVATKSPREQYLERHCEWLQQELARYVRN